MRISLLAFGALLLAPASSALAQTTPSANDRATAMRDSLFMQAAAVRAEVAVRLAQFQTNSASINGLRTITRVSAANSNGRPYCIKRHVIKRKTSGWLLEKIEYYDSRQRTVMQEQYQNGQLTRLQLNTYSGAFFSKPYRTFTFTQGDYLRRSIYPSKLSITDSRPASHEYHYLPAPPVAR